MHPVERSDILRLELVHRFGGVYVDTDVECLRPIDPLLEGVTFFVERLNSGRLTHPIMGAVPEHPLLGRAIREMKPSAFLGYDKHASGPDYVASGRRRRPGRDDLSHRGVLPAHARGAARRVHRPP